LHEAAKSPRAPLLANWVNVVPVSTGRLRFERFKVNEKPIGEALVICDQIITEVGTNKKSLIGIFNSIASLQFPTQHTRLCVFCAMSNGRGEMMVELRCVRMDDSYEVARIAGKMDFPDPNRVIELVATFNNIPFDRPGLYTFEMHCEGEMILEKRFNVLSLPAQGQSSTPSQLNKKNKRGKHGSYLRQTRSIPG
jgi:hypothetical protein